MKRGLVYIFLRLVLGMSALVKLVMAWVYLTQPPKGTVLWMQQQGIQIPVLGIWALASGLVIIGVIPILRRWLILGIFLYWLATLPTLYYTYQTFVHLTSGSNAMGFLITIIIDIWAYLLSLITVFFMSLILISHKD